MLISGNARFAAWVHRVIRRNNDEISLADGSESNVFLYADVPAVSLDDYALATQSWDVLLNGRCGI